MKYKVTISTLFIAGQKYKRGDIVDVSENLALSLGTQLEPIVEGEKMKPRRTRKKVETKNEDW
tara:strand:- start:343 stop:531 length:189 start_codon:yes stop_codon:yes gene_type:complete